MNTALIERDRILQHTRQYRMTVPLALANASSNGLSAKAARFALEHLVHEGLLGKAPLFRRKEYYFLTENAVGHLAEHEEHKETDQQVIEHGALSEPAKIRAFAFLSYCCLGKTRRARLTSVEMQSRFPGLVAAGQAQRYYVDSSQSHPVLGFLRVDIGGPGRWDRVVRSFRQDILSHTHRPEFHQLIQEGQFELAVATALPQKAERIRTALNAAEALEHIALRMVVIPDLLHLIAPPPN